MFFNRSLIAALVPGAMMLVFNALAVEAGARGQSLNTAHDLIKRSELYHPTQLLRRDMQFANLERRTPIERKFQNLANVAHRQDKHAAEAVYRDAHNRFHTPDTTLHGNQKHHEKASDHHAQRSQALHLQGNAGGANQHTEMSRAHTTVANVYRAERSRTGRCTIC